MVAGRWWLFRMESRESFWRVNELGEGVDIRGLLWKERKEEGGLYYF